MMSEAERPWLNSYPDEVSPTIDAHAYENINELFEDSCRRYASHTAFINMSGRMTYGDLAVLSERFASFLQHQLHLGRGDRMALMMPNLMQYPVCYFGALRAGLTIININPLYTPRELLLQLQDCEAQAIVVLENFAARLAGILRKTRLRHVIITRIGDCLGRRGVLINFYLKWIKSAVPSFRIRDAISLRDALRLGARRPSTPVTVHYDDLALLQYTGGTTGRAKGAMLTHGNILANIAQCHGMYGPVLVRGEEKIVTAIPLYHVFAMTVNMLFLFSLGGTNLLITDPRRIRDFIRDLQRHADLTVLVGVNTLFNALLHFRVFDTIRFTRLKLAIGGGAAIQSGVARRFHEATGIHILEGYGLTECSPLVCVCPYTTTSYTGTIGIPVPSTEVRILDEDGSVITALDTPGELTVRGPQVMQGYYHNDLATRAALSADGFCRTGDIAVWKEGGYLKIIDRIKDMILVSGFNVYPAEIEDVVSQLEGVVECAAIGVPSDATGEGVCLYVVPREGSALDEKAVRSFCRTSLTGYKVPREIIFTAQLPHTTVGKVSRRLLRESYSRQFYRETPSGAQLAAPPGRT